MRRVAAVALILRFASLAFCISAARFTDIWEDVLRNWQESSDGELLHVPDMFIMGPRRSGIRSFTSLLLQHHQICVPQNHHSAALHFFDRSGVADDLAARRWYAQQFRRVQHCTTGATLVDATAEYFVAAALAADQMKRSFAPRVLNQKKFILLLREPVARELSAYAAQRRQCSLAIEATLWQPHSDGSAVKVAANDIYCDHILANRPHGILDGWRPQFVSFDVYFKTVQQNKTLLDSNYDELLSHWLKVLQPQQLFVIDIQQLLGNSSTVMRQISSFVGLSSSWGRLQLPHINAAMTEYYPSNAASKTNSQHKYHLNASISCKLLEELQQRFHDSNSRLLELLTTSGVQLVGAFPDYNSIASLERLHCSDEISAQSAVI